MAEIKAPRRVDLFRSLGTFSTEKLRHLRSDLEEQIQSGEFYDQTAEVGRSSSSQLLADPHLSLEVVVKLLIKRGALTAEEVAVYRQSLPKTKTRILFGPRYW